MATMNTTSPSTKYTSENGNRAREEMKLRPFGFAVGTTAVRVRLRSPLLQRDEGGTSSIGAMKVGAHFLPRERLHAAGAVVRHAALDLSRPGFFCVGSRMIVEALEEETGELGPVAGWQFRCLLVQVLDGSAHDDILPPTWEVGGPAELVLGAPSPKQKRRAGARRLFAASIETLRLALQRERGSFSNCPRRHAHSPALPWLGPRWAQTEGSRSTSQRFSPPKQKGALRPFVAVVRRGCC